MAEGSIPVDLFNPGQVFACIGFAEAADVLLGGAEGCFDWSIRDAARFRLRASGHANPIEHVLRFLSHATVTAEAPHRSVSIDGWLRTWGSPPVPLPKGAPYPSADPDSAALLVVLLEAGEQRLRLDYWADATQNSKYPIVVTGRDNAKLWGGSRGYPAAALARDLLQDIRGADSDRVVEAPFDVAAPQANSYNLDWRRNYIPIDAGFSLNEHKNTMSTTGFPIVEILGALGLANARPRRIGTKYDLRYDYGVVGSSRDVVWLPLAFLRAALGVSATPFEMRRFRMFLGWPGKEGQARAITQVTEESVS